MNQVNTFGTLIIVIFVAWSVHSYPKDETSTVTMDLKYTFDGTETIPSVFFETTSTSSQVSTNSKKMSTQSRSRYPACKDGSGGLCAPSGTCPTDKKPEKQIVGACDAGLECCFDVPPSNTPCQDKGGECVQTSKCGKGPQLKSSTECRHGNGETCCIWVS